MIQEKHPLVYIVILTWNHWDVTAVLLENLKKLSYPNFRIIIVDNGSVDKTVQNIQAKYPSHLLIENGRNLGFAPGCNIGMQCALDNNADYILLLNNDTVVPSNLLNILVSQAQSLHKPGIMTPSICYQEKPNKLWFAGSRKHPFTLEALDFGPTGPHRHTLPNQLHEVDYIFGTAMFLPAEVLKQVGLFDENFFLYYEDMDLSLRIQAAGYHLYYIPNVAVNHQISASTDDFSAFRYYHKARGSVIFFRKHSTWARKFIIIPYRFASAIRTTVRLAKQKQWDSIKAYFSGLIDGMKIKRE